MDLGNIKIETVAGTGALCDSHMLPCGFGGVATKAALAWPMAVAPLPDGSYLIAERGGPGGPHTNGNNGSNTPRISRVDGATGIITVVAGDNRTCQNPTAKVNPCGDNGPATAAQLNIPHYVIAIPSGFVIADRGNSRVRLVTFADGIIRTIAGDGHHCKVGDRCGDGGLATRAQINYPQGVSAYNDGRILITGKDNRVRMLALDQTISTVAGSGAFCPNTTDPCGDGKLATHARFNDPHGVAALTNGAMLIADKRDNRIRKVNEQGIITTVAGTGVACQAPTDPCGDGGPAVAARLNGPVEVTAVVGGGFLINDSGDSRVRYVDPDGIIHTIAGSGEKCLPGEECGGESAVKAILSRPHGTAVTDRGVYIADRNDNRVRLVAIRLP